MPFILLKHGMTEIGLLENSSLLFALNTGVTSAIFSSFGITPVQ